MNKKEEKFFAHLIDTFAMGILDSYTDENFSSLTGLFNLTPEHTEKLKTLAAMGLDIALKEQERDLRLEHIVKQLIERGCDAKSAPLVANACMQAIKAHQSEAVDGHEEGFHGFYYTDDEERDYILYPLESHVKEFITQKILPKLTPLDEETYWRKYAKYMLSAVKSSYFAWEEKSYWALELDPFIVLEFSPGKMRCYEQPSTRITQTNPDPEYDIIFTSFDAIAEETTCDWTDMSSDNIFTMEHNIDWTNELHKRMDIKIPLDETHDERAGKPTANV